MPMFFSVLFSRSGLVMLLRHALQISIRETERLWVHISWDFQPGKQRARLLLTYILNCPDVLERS